MTNPFNDPVDYGDGEEGLDYEDLVDHTGVVRDRVGIGQCRNRDEIREADHHADLYEKWLGL